MKDMLVAVDPLGTFGLFSVTTHSLRMGFRQGVVCRAHVMEHVRAGLPDILAGGQIEDL